MEGAEQKIYKEFTYHLEIRKAGVSRNMIIMRRAHPDGSKGITIDGCSDSVLLLRISSEIHWGGCDSSRCACFWKKQDPRRGLSHTITKIEENAFEGCGKN